MTKPHRAQPARPPFAPRFLPVLLLLFVGSGCSALIYEIVWFQLLQLVIGSSAVSLAVLLGTFMGGTCLGSVALPRLVPARRHPLRVYALLELGIGLIGLAVLYGMPAADQLYGANGGRGFGGIFLRGAVCGVFLLPPTVLMGGTLPAIARWVGSGPERVPWLGYFYGANIAGAVFGCLLAGFYLLRVHDMETATYVAVAVNGTVALAGLALAALAPAPEPSDKPGRSGGPKTEPAPGSAARAPRWGMVHLVIGLSGLCALSAEVVWTRLLSLLLGGTVYTFSIILAVFLTGLGIGSSIGSLLARTTAETGGGRPRLLLGGCQLLLAGAIAWTALILAQSLPYWPINPSLSPSPWFNFQLDLVRCVWAILPATILWGASFPLALASIASPGQDAGRVVGGVYAANTIGAILGAAGSSLVLIAWLGTKDSQRLLIGLSAAAAFLTLLVPLWRFRAGKSAALEIRVVGTVGLAASIGLAAWWLARGVAEVPGQLVAYGRSLPSRLDQAEVLYMGEGMNASVAVTRLADGTRNFHVSGKIEASTEPQDMRLQRMLGHLPALLHPRPRSVLVVGCGAGVTLGSFVPHPDVERIVLCEIEPLIPKVVAHHFAEENYHVLSDSRLTVVYDDARHHVRTTPDTFDIITSDPIHPWVKGAATLYTKEYFELCKRHLNPGGVVTQWVPLYESDLDTVKSEIATFMEAFPDGTVWSNDLNGKGYDLVLLGQVPAAPIDIEELQQRLERDDHGRVARSLKDVGFRGAIDLLATYAGQGPELKPWLKGAAINRDRNLRLQYLAGMGANFYREGAIFEEIVGYRTFPEDLFVAAGPRRIMLKHLLEARPSDR
jgi:spermidine synthase